MDISNLKIAAYVPDKTACGYYRITIPFIYIYKYGLCNKVQILESPILDALGEYDIIIAQRETTLTMAEDLQKLKSMGKVIIVDTDDLLEDVHPTNPAYKIYHPGSERLNNYFKVLKLANGITTPTTELQTNYRDMNPNIHVVPNYIDFDVRKWTTKQIYEKDTINISWAGSSSHLNDLMIIGPVLNEILNKYPQARYMHFGDGQLLKFLVTKFNLPQNQVIHLKPVPFNNYPEQLVHFDIGLCPLADNRFNSSKSHLKPLEYGSVGIPSIVSDVSPYRKYIKHGKDGFVATSKNDWIKYISILIEDRQKFISMSQEAYNKAKENDLKDHINEWLEAWGKIIENKSMGKKGKIGRNEQCPCGSGLKAKKCKCYPIYC
jgi:glycosyltransferase involved in cell wall biosynthesis